jgi:hypothetical protein
MFFLSSSHLVKISWYGYFSSLLVCCSLKVYLLISRKYFWILYFYFFGILFLNENTYIYIYIYIIKNYRGPKLDYDSCLSLYNTYKLKSFKGLWKISLQKKKKNFGFEKKNHLGAYNKSKWCWCLSAHQHYEKYLGFFMNSLCSGVLLVCEKISRIFHKWFFSGDQIVVSDRMTCLWFVFG